MRILLALDGSKHSAAVRDALISQAKTSDAEVHLLHVVEPFPIDLVQKLGSQDSPDFPSARLEQREWAKEMLAQAAEKLRSTGFIVTSSVEEGDAREVILNHAKRWGADLIMVGSHGRTGLIHFLMGSVSEAVARHAGCSVEIVRIQPVH
jgi:nucleotide-binding universal stress UspA family protein